MSKRKANGYEARPPRVRKVRWATRGGIPASLVGFHRLENLLPLYRKLVAESSEPPAKGERVQAACSMTLRTARRD